MKKKKTIWNTYSSSEIKKIIKINNILFALTILTTLLLLFFIIFIGQLNYYYMVVITNFCSLVILNFIMFFYQLYLKKKHPEDNIPLCRGMSNNQACISLFLLFLTFIVAMLTENELDTFFGLVKFYSYIIFVIVFSVYLLSLSKKRY